MWEIYAYQDADTLAGVFNAIAAIAGAQDFKGAIAMVAFYGFVTAFTAYAFAPQKLIGWQWLASVTLVLSILFVPRVQVEIIDKTGGGAERFVDNVPLGLAVLASPTSTVGHVTASLFETAFQAIPGPAGLPPELAYQKSGLMFGNRLIRKTSRVVFTEPRFRTDLINFIANCTMYDLADGTVAPADFANSGNVWPLMATPNPARFSTITDASGETQVMPCPAIYTALDKLMPTQVKRIHDSLALELNPTLPTSVVASVLVGQIEQTYIKTQIADAAATAADIVRQNAMINAINDTSMLIGQKINDAPAMMLAVGRAQAVAQTNASWINSGKVAEEGLPVIRNVIEALVYALFPVWVLLVLLTSGKETMMSIKNYSAVLIFIQLWPVLYAILNYLATIYAAKELAAAADVGGGLKALSLSTSNSIYSNAISSEAVVGYLTASIPFIAWFAMKRMENFGTAVLSGWSTLQSTLTADSNAAAVGNTGMGNVTMDQMTLTPSRSSPYFRARQDDSTGNILTTNASSGLTAIKALMNEGPASRQIVVGLTKSEVTEAQRSVAAAKAEARTSSHEYASAVADVISSARAFGKGDTQSEGAARSESSTTGQRASELKQIAANVSRQTGASIRQVTEVALGGSLKADTSTPIGAQGALKAQTGTSGTLDQLDQKVRTSLSSEDSSKFRDFAESISKDSRALSNVFSETREGEEHSKRITATAARMARAEENLRSEEAYSERIASMFSRGESISLDMAKDPNHATFFADLLRTQKLGSGAMLRRLESYLGNEALPPMRVASESLPNTFESVRSQYHSEPTGLGNALPNIDAGTTPPSKSHTNPLGSPAKNIQLGTENAERLDSVGRKLHNHKDGIERSGVNIDGDVTKKILEFEDSNGIEIGKDGQPHPGKGNSLVGKVYSSMENSRDPVSDTVGDGIRALAKKLRPEKKPK
ncbi:hypothetical protein RugamoR57_48860 [Duganella caerulea]|uniref:conjugal transfer protein TraG N-terminal domain-containing protein n=1 Tax=Duganella caerulea TaxID=2885762 RepID=UPI0030EA51F7